MIALRFAGTMSTRLVADSMALPWLFLSPSDKRASLRACRCHHQITYLQSTIRPDPVTALDPSISIIIDQLGNRTLVYDIAVFDGNAIIWVI
jgi:hypothetical protein